MRDRRLQVRMRLTLELEVALQRFVRGGVHFHLDSEAQAEEQLRRCGFAAASVRPGTDFDSGSGGTDSLTINGTTNPDYFLLRAARFGKLRSQRGAWGQSSVCANSRTASRIAS